MVEFTTGSSAGGLSGHCRPACRSKQQRLRRVTAAKPAAAPLYAAVLPLLALPQRQKLDVEKQRAVGVVQGGVVQHKVQGALAPKVRRLRAVSVPAGVAAADGAVSGRLTASSHIPHSHPFPNCSSSPHPSQPSPPQPSLESADKALGAVAGVGERRDLAQHLHAPHAAHSHARDCLLKGGDGLQSGGWGVNGCVGGMMAKRPVTLRGHKMCGAHALPAPHAEQSRGRVPSPRARPA